MPEAVLFDLDGTLVDSVEDIFVAVNRLLSELGLKTRSRDEVAMWVGNGARMLVERNSTLCLKCHFQQQTAAGIFIGGQEHSSRLTRGACWSAGCHEAVHGSHVGSSLRF